MNFRELGLVSPLLNNLKAMGYEAPTPIQSQSIPPALAGRDILGCAQTGTGKTCAFAAPILQRLAAEKKPGPRAIRALILTPTRELALQIGENMEAYGKGMPLRLAVIFGGVGQQPQVEKIKNGLDILVATPGRLLDLHNQRLLDLSRVEIFVLDEADRMLDMGFIHDVRRVLKVLPQKKQTLFFSATMPPEVMELVDSLLHSPVRVAVDPISSPVEVIDQCVYFVDKGNKTKLLAKLVEEKRIPSALVFSRTKHGANKIARELNELGLSAAAIHGNKSQSARQQALADFKAGKVRLLVATDIAARGIDIEEMPCVFNYNLPEVPETYVHRIGRTGRAGHEGIAIAFCDFGDQEYLKGIEKLIGRSLPVRESEWPMQVLEVPEKQPRGGQKKAVKAPKEKPVPKGSAPAKPVPVKEELPKTEQPKAEGGKKRKKKKGAKPEQNKAMPVEKTEKGKIAPVEKAEKVQDAPAKKDGQSKPASAVKAERSKAAPVEHRPLGGEKGKKKFAPPTKTLAEFEAEERAFQERIARERKERNTVRQMGALAGEVIMDATARLLAPRKKTVTPHAPQPIREERPSRKQAPKAAHSAQKEQKAAQSAQPVKKEKQAPKAQSAQPVKKASKAAPAAKPVPVRAEQPAPKQVPAGGKKKKAERPRRDSMPRPGDVRPGRIKDSTEQPSLMKPFYFGPED